MEITDNNLKTTNLNDVKSKYILKKIFNNIEKLKLLNIIRCKKSLQSKINIDKNTYKEYLEIQFEIENRNNYPRRKR